jgi:hypothetical protein
MGCHSLQEFHQTSIHLLDDHLVAMGDRTKEKRTHHHVHPQNSC